MFEAHDSDGERPSQHDGHQGSGIEEQPIAQPGGGNGQELAFLREVRREEYAEHDQAQLHRLELDGAEMDPQAGTVDVGPHVGDEW
jgi:hypothetical protein